MRSAGKTEHTLSPQGIKNASNQDQDDQDPDENLCNLKFDLSPYFKRRKKSAGAAKKYLKPLYPPKRAASYCKAASLKTKSIRLPSAERSPARENLDQYIQNINEESEPFLDTIKSHSGDLSTGGNHLTFNRTIFNTNSPNQPFREVEPDFQDVTEKQSLKVNCEPF